MRLAGDDYTPAPAGYDPAAPWAVDVSLPGGSVPSGNYMEPYAGIISQGIAAYVSTNSANQNAETVRQLAAKGLTPAGYSRPLYPAPYGYGITPAAAPGFSPFPAGTGQDFTPVLMILAALGIAGYIVMGK